MEQQDKELRVRNSKVFKLKDKPTRQYVSINFLRNFNFIPETIIIEKLHGHTNTFVVRAVLTEEEIEKEDKIKQKQLEKLSVHINKEDGKQGDRGTTESVTKEERK